jgi:hypothetical protein
MLQCMITETREIEPLVYDCGAVKWVANRDLNPRPLPRASLPRAT